MIKLRQLIHANALIKQRNFRKAARTQNISHPAFSRSIANLEETLGVKLFHRHPSGVSATVYGQTVEKYARQILTAAQELEREIKIIKEVGLGELAVALGPYPAELSGHKAIGKLISDSPDIRCEVVVKSWQEVERLVIDHQVDLGLAELGQAIENIDLETELIAKHQGVLYCRAGHPMLKKQKVSQTDLEHYPFVGVKIPFRLASLLPGKIYPEKGGEHAYPSVQIEDIALSRHIVEESDAISIAVPIQIEDELKTGLFSIVPFEASWLFSNYGFMYLRDRALSPAAIKYMKIVRDLEQEVYVRNKELIKRYVQ